MSIAPLLSGIGILLFAAGTPRQAQSIGPGLTLKRRVALRRTALALLAAALLVIVVGEDRARSLASLFGMMTVEAGGVALLFTLRVEQRSKR